MASVSVRPFRTGDERAFKTLNLAWIESMFSVEPSDLAQLDDPQAQIIDRGGQVLIAEVDGIVVGTAGLVAAPEAGKLELVKMSAREDLRGTGIGKALMAACIETARAMGARCIWLESNRMLDPALGLYRAAGFRELSAEELSDTPYSRCDIQMALDL